MEGFIKQQQQQRRQQNTHTQRERLYLIISMKGFIQIIRRLPVAVYMNNATRVHASYLHHVIVCVLALLQLSLVLDRVREATGVAAIAWHPGYAA